MVNRKVFSDPLISYKDIESNLINIFPDAIITDTQFVITDISPTVSKLLQYKYSEIVGKPLSFIVSDEFNLSQFLSQGYFTHTRFALTDKNGQGVDVFLSGYFMGLISDINGKIVLLVKDQKNILHDKKKASKQVLELSDLIYRTSHDIRGPLATIKGLVNAAEFETETVQLQKYLALISQVSGKLDLSLEYLRESLARKNYRLYITSIDELLTEISDRVSKLSAVYDISVEVSMTQKSEGSILCSNSFLVSILIENIVLILESLKVRKHGKYSIQLALNKEQIQFYIQTEDLKDVAKVYLADEMNFRNIKKIFQQCSYHYLNFRVIKICADLLKSTLAINESTSPSLMVTIPFVFNKDNNS